MTDKSSFDKLSFQELEHQVASLKKHLADLERKNLELQDAEEKFRTLAADVQAVLYRIDPQGVIEEVNSTIETLLGYSPDELQGRNFTDLVYNPDLPSIVEAFGAVAGGELKPDEYRLVSKAGQPIWVRTLSRPIFTEGQFRGIRGVFDGCG